MSRELTRFDVQQVDGIDEKSELLATLKAMETMGIMPEEQSEIVSLTAGVLHLGNIIFSEDDRDNEKAKVHLSERLAYPSYLLKIDQDRLAEKLTSRVLESKWGSSVERVQVTCNPQQAENIRDALAKGLYARLFDHLIKVRI